MPFNPGDIVECVEGGTMFITGKRYCVLLCVPIGSSGRFILRLSNLAWTFADRFVGVV
jgi:hypothetical protein